MQVSVTGELFEVIIHNTFEFAKCRELLASCRAHAKINPRASARITLENIATFNMCGIATISLICDWMQAGVELDLQGCGTDVHTIFDTGIFDKYFSKHTPFVRAACRDCLESTKPRLTKDCPIHKTRPRLPQD
ncbi:MULTISPECIES: hypothetical protein [Methylomonas]|uniref:STAS domain-containing protein n=2 Tax=Methylomonas TaxID=416 RepID=A0A126T2J8_9GAMM|nr:MULTISPECIES: hypothetical protein [Methylomonas]AMK76311.1 hypothetical protein JT25_007360 [Methylomonas denitrificans]OAI00747.1 hypothetical protein A1342_17765 [Methylomonas methanica]TCV88332.1 hypothetical protein EDE11_101119 [Methylomonas methanica]